jgi:hypothetical protein
MLLIKFLMVLSWIVCPISLFLVIVCPIWQMKYEASMEYVADRMKNVKKDYMHFWGKFVFAFVLSLVYLIVYYTT